MKQAEGCDGNNSLAVGSEVLGSICKPCHLGKLLPCVKAGCWPWSPKVIFTLVECGCRSLTRSPETDRFLNLCNSYVKECPSKFWWNYQEGSCSFFIIQQKVASSIHYKFDCHVSKIQWNWRRFRMNHQNDIMRPLFECSNLIPAKKTIIHLEMSAKS